MAFLKSKWRMLAFFVICAASLGVGGWAYMAGDSVNKSVKELDDLRKQVDGVKGTKANIRIIEERKRQIDKSNSDFEKSMNTALAVQKASAFDSEPSSDGTATPKPRTLLIDKVLPKPTNAQAINFKEAYAKAFDELKQRLQGRDKPTTKEITDMNAAIKARKPSTAGIDLGPWSPAEASATN